MKDGFRQSMAWLHTWVGLVAGTLLYFIFATGTAGYFDTEIDYWMRPETPPRVAAVATADALAVALARLDSVAPGAARWTIYPPSSRDLPEITTYWYLQPDASGRTRSGSEVLDSTTGLPIEARATAGGATLYQMHYRLRYLPTTAADWVVGVCTMLMLVALVSGLVTHKKIFRHFFTFRPRKGQRSWLDAHNLVSVMALPFHLMITYSGLVFFCFTYMPFVVAASYGSQPADQQTFFDEVFERGVAAERRNVAAPLAPIATMIEAAEERWGPGQIRFVDIGEPGDAGAVVTFGRGHLTHASTADRIVFAGATGTLVTDTAEPWSGPAVFNETMMSLHEGLFAGTALRWLYFLSGLFGTIMIATGLVHWTAKRRKTLASGHAGLAFVERLNVGTIVGLPIGIAAYFWANRLLPAGLAGRPDWEVHVLFIAWAVMLAYPILRPLERAWRESLLIAAALYLALPLLSGLATGRHLAVSLAAGDWVFAGFDLTMLALGAVFLCAAQIVQPREASMSVAVGAGGEGRAAGTSTRSAC